MEWDVGEESLSAGSLCMQSCAEPVTCEVVDIHVSTGLNTETDQPWENIHSGSTECLLAAREPCFPDT